MASGGKANDLNMSYCRYPIGNLKLFPTLTTTNGRLFSV